MKDDVSNQLNVQFFVDKGIRKLKLCAIYYFSVTDCKLLCDDLCNLCR